ncbi:MAG: hypothetical protein ACYST6_11965, partial [Planctomycetota bacterium]
MARKKAKTILEEKASEKPLDSELFAEEDPSGFDGGSPALTSSEAPPDRELFVGDEELYNLLAGSAESSTAKDARSVIQASWLKIRKKRFATLEKVLIVSIMAIAAFLVYALLTSGAQPKTHIGATQGAQQETSSAEKASGVQPQLASDVPQAGDSGGTIRQEAAPMLPQEQMLSLRTAEALYLRKDYEQASAAYKQLVQFPAEGEAEEAVRDFLRLRIAL